MRLEDTRPAGKRTQDRERDRGGRAGATTAVTDPGYGLVAAAGRDFEVGQKMLFMRFWPK